MIQGLYAITDPFLCGDRLLQKCEAALQGGAQILQYRNKHLPPEEQFRQAQQLQALCRHYDCCFIINDNPEMARKLGADGVHIGQGDARIHEARELLGKGKLIGVSCHNDLSLAQQAASSGASYVAFGRFFPSRTKPEAPPAQPSTLTHAKSVLPIPVVAIGGITRDNAALLVNAGADALAVIHDLFAPDDCAEILQRARTFRLFFEHKSEDQPMDCS